MTESTASLVPLVENLEDVISSPPKQMLERINAKNAEIRANNARRQQAEFDLEEQKMIKRLAFLARDRIENFLDNSNESAAEMGIVSVSVEAHDWYPQLTKHGFVTTMMKVSLSTLFQEMGRVEVKVVDGSLFQLNVYLNEFDEDQQES